MFSAEMHGKAANTGWVMRSNNPKVQWWFKILTMALLLRFLIVWSFYGVNVGNFQRDLVLLKVNNSSGKFSPTFKDFSFTNISLRLHSVNTHQNLNQDLARKNLAPKVEPQLINLTENQGNAPDFSLEMVTNVSHKELELVEVSRPRVHRWISAELEANYSSNLLTNWLAPGGEPCRESRTVDVKIPALDGRENVELSAGDIHEFVFHALDYSGKPHCLGGDYFETDLAGETWKSRPPLKDLGNGTYHFSLQVHPDFAGDYNLMVILLFRHYEGLTFSPERFAYDKVLRVIPVKFSKSSVELPEISQCKKSDLVRDVWSGRWTRHAKNNSCSISNDGRYRCQEPNFPCQKPWCDGPLGLLESNGWVYSTHCSFKMFSSEVAWNCLTGRWIFWWGDSNHCDTVRNILNFILDVNDKKDVPRRVDMNISNPRNPSKTVRFTNIYNGHPNETGKYRGLNSLTDADYRELLKGYFSGNVVPDTIIMNSGLHDGVYWPNIRHFIKGADYAASFWAEVFNGVRQRGLTPPEVIYRTTVTTGGYARRLAFNPNKMEAFNGVVLDKLRAYGLVDRVIDDFDMTYPWHYDNRCNDGVHYGRAPAKLKWRDGQIGHQYFVDLMLGHVLLNALCAG
ncbi:uncharacterized protein LOC107766202 [Nicotiana tabacum]|uniref:Uncharacterized protein LOC107766202 n=1 Tax=Nicotiana tabacum TaxID=4097 RepID=A0A1S3XKI1_TOBAC|nr:uncharacterized protein LOC104102622 [Nicotiana tomentosiformis]XP_016440436.1 PREDICTED: uncharacterized protein LOC107766202 [Nicotiana tabacum]